MQESWVGFLGQEDPLEKEMETHSRILAWEILRIEEPGRLQSMRSQSWTTERLTQLYAQHIQLPIILSWKTFKTL